jgi:acyl-CoA synthetase (AMP-forming)/AMP-acid ligase II
VGYPIKGTAVTIIKITDAPIEQWSDELLAPAAEVGEVVVRGRVVTHAYYNRPESTALAKISDPVTGTVLHRMGDLGYFDEGGRLWMCGRKAHRVETGEETLFTIPCERIFDEHPAVRRTALVGVGAQGTAKPVLCVELNDHAARDEGKLREELRGIAEGNPKTRSIETFLFHPAFPVDIRHNAKIFREKLSRWAGENLS